MSDMAVMDMDMVDTKTKTQTKTITKCFKDPMYAIFLKSRAVSKGDMRISAFDYF